MKVYEAGFGHHLAPGSQTILKTGGNADKCVIRDFTGRMEELGMKIMR